MAIVAIALVGLVAVPAIGMAQLLPDDTVREEETGVEFPVALIPPGDREAQWLVGTGVRETRFFGVNVYAFGLYVEPESTRLVLADLVGLPAATLVQDEEFFGRVLALDFPMTFRLVMARDVSGNAIADSFEDALRPRFARLALLDATGAEAEDGRMLDRFRGYFNIDRVEKGTEIVFSCGPDGVLFTSVGGSERAPIESRTLCVSLFDVYLGSDPISPDGKRSVVARMPELLEGRFGPG